MGYTWPGHTWPARSYASLRLPDSRRAFVTVQWTQNSWVIDQTQWYGTKQKTPTGTETNRQNCMPGTSASGHSKSDERRTQLSCSTTEKSEDRSTAACTAAEGAAVKDTKFRMHICIKPTNREGGDRNFAWQSFLQNFKLRFPIV